MKSKLLFFSFFLSVFSIYAQTSLEFTTQDIASSSLGNRAFGARDVHAIDLDHDGDIDILSASLRDNRITWYENDGTQNFTTHDIASPTLGNMADGAQAVLAADLDADNDLDVISISQDDNRVTWYENDGNQNFTTQDISSPAIGGTVPSKPISLIVNDLDKDGDIDVIVGDDTGQQIVWYKNNGSAGFISIVIASPSLGNGINQVEALFATDLDNDGNIDILAASTRGKRITWFKNDGSNGFTLFDIASESLGNRPNGSTSVYAADLDSDGDLDVMSTSSSDNKITWYENDGSQNFTTHDIVQNPLGLQQSNPRDLISTDLDNDGDIDLLVAIAGITFGDSIKWYENDGNQNFTGYDIASNSMGNEPRFAWRAFVKDMDGDGDLDVLSASYGDSRIVVYYSNQSVLNTNEFNLDNIGLYPNPISNILNISNPQALDIKKIELFDVTGKLIKSSNLLSNASQIPINLENISKGIYILNLKSNLGKISKRVVKQ